MAEKTDHVRDMMQRLSTGSKIDSNNLKEAVEKISYGAGIKTEDYPEFDTVCRITNEISDHAVEIQHEIFENAIEAWGFKKSDVENALIELQEYRKIGTVEEVREAVEKTRPIKPDVIEIEPGTKYLKCSKCKLTTVIYNEMIVGYCPKCGQKLVVSE